MALANPRRQALLDALGPDDPQQQAAPVGRVPAGGGDYIPAQSIYDTSGLSDAQRAAYQGTVDASRQRDAAGFARDQAYLASRGGAGPEAGYQFYQPNADPTPEAFGGKLVGGSLFDQQQHKTSGAAPVAPTTAAPDPSDPLSGQLANMLHGDLSANFHENHYSQDQALKGAGQGALEGSKFGGIGAGYGAAAGAIMGALKGRTNDTKNEREQFAQSLGVPNTTALWDLLSQQLDPTQADQLKNVALNRIGKHDETANQQWMQMVQTALANGKPAPDAGGAGGAGSPPGSAPGAAPRSGIVEGDQRPTGAPATVADGAAPTWSPGAKAGQKVTLLGFDRDKLEDPSSGSAAGSKYTPAVKAFYNGLKQDVGVSRGGLDNMANYLKANGFKDAKVVGDDKIDFGDGNGPVDVIRSDGQIVFQNTTGNPTWEGKYGGGGGASGGGMAGLAGHAAPSAGGYALDSALTGDPLAKIQQALAQYAGKRPNFDALMQQLGA